MNEQTSSNPETATTPATEAQPPRKQFDHDAIRTDLQNDVSVKDVATQHGCSVSLVQRIRRELNGNGETTPRNVQRAVQARKRAEQVGKDITLASKWVVNQAKMPPLEDGSPYNGVTTLIGVLTEAKEQLELAAELLEDLPADVVKTARPSSRVVFEVGQAVRPKEKFRESYASMLDFATHLTVKSIRDTHVMIEDDTGTRCFLQANTLELHTDA